MDEPTFRFSGEVIHWRGPAPWHFVRVPPEVADDLRALAAEVTYGWGMIPARVSCGHSEWETSLWPKDGGYLVPIKTAPRKAENIDLGDVIALELLVEPRGGRPVHDDEDSA